MPNMVASMNISNLLEGNEHARVFIWLGNVLENFPAAAIDPIGGNAEFGKIVKKRAVFMRKILAEFERRHLEIDAFETILHLIAKKHSFHERRGEVAGERSPWLVIFSSSMDLRKG